MHSSVRTTLRFIVLLLLASALIFPLTTTVLAAVSVETGSDLIYVIPVHHTIESGLQRFLERSFDDAKENRAAYIVLDIDTFGGSIAAAEAIGKLIRNSDIPTVAFIHGKAISAGSYIAMNADQIVMEPGSSMGSAAVVTVSGDRVTDSKTISAWTGLMTSAAEMNGRNPLIAAGMVDEDVVVDMQEIGRIKQQGQLISLTAEEALKVGYAEHTAEDMDELLQWLHVTNYELVKVELSVAEQLARFLTNPVVMTILLMIGLSGIAIELFVPGFGFPGIAGTSALVLYFFGHFVAGFAESEHIVMFVAGIVLLLLEIFIPSFGVLGILGFISLVGGIVLAAYDTGQAVIALTISFIAAIIIVVVIAQIFKHKGIWNRFILSESLTKEKGFVPAPSLEALLGQHGVTLTELRPAGKVRIGDELIDVVSDGDFIEKNCKVQVYKVEGAKVVVRQEG